MQFVAIKAVLLFTGLTILLVRPTALQEHCTLPTEQDVKEILDAFFANAAAEDTTPATVQDIFEVYFTCLAKVGKDMYAFATVIANLKITTSVGSKALKSQLRCEGGAWKASLVETTGRSVLFTNTVTQFQCYKCESIPPHCLCECQTAWGIRKISVNICCLSTACAPECLGRGGGFCTGMTADDCCPFFNSDTGDYVSNCTTVDINFGYDDNFTCGESIGNGRIHILTLLLPE